MRDDDGEFEQTAGAAAGGLVVLWQLAGARVAMDMAYNVRYGWFYLAVHLLKIDKSQVQHFMP